MRATNQRERDVPSIPAGAVASADATELASSFKWRFYRADDARWRWEKISSAHEVLASSGDAFSTYSECVADASAAGYRPLPSLSGLVPMSFVHEPEAGPGLRLRRDSLRTLAPLTGIKPALLKKKAQALGSVGKKRTWVASPRGTAAVKRAQERRALSPNVQPRSTHAHKTR